jgi:hypothetical protein
MIRQGVLPNSSVTTKATYLQSALSDWPPSSLSESVKLFDLRTWERSAPSSQPCGRRRPTRRERAVIVQPVARLLPDSQPPSRER